MTVRSVRMLEAIRTILEVRFAWVQGSARPQSQEVIPKRLRHSAWTGVGLVKSIAAEATKTIESVKNIFLNNVFIVNPY